MLTLIVFAFVCVCVCILDMAEQAKVCYAAMA